MKGWIIKVVLLLVVGIIGYNYFFGSAEEKANAQQIVGQVQKLTHSVADLLKSEKVGPWGDPDMRTRIVLLASLAITLFAGNVLACGDSLYRVGKGVSYRVYTAPLPGSVLVYGEGEGAELLARELARSGHGVRLVKDDEELQAELGSGTYDVVIAAYSEKSAVAHDADADAPTFLPVALNEEEEQQAREEHERVMVAEKDEIKHYLKAIHQALKQRG